MRWQSSKGLCCWVYPLWDEAILEIISPEWICWIASQPRWSHQARSQDKHLSCPPFFPHPSNSFLSQTTIFLFLPLHYTKINLWICFSLSSTVSRRGNCLYSYKYRAWKIAAEFINVYGMNEWMLLFLFPSVLIRLFCDDSPSLSDFLLHRFGRGPWELHGCVSVFPLYPQWSSILSLVHVGPKMESKSVRADGNVSAP